MNLLKRLTTSVTATLDTAVCQLENHDAIVNATIKQTRQSVARTKARINTLRQQQSVYESQLVDAHEQMQLWEKRAAELAANDQQKALECLARRNTSEQETKRLEKSIAQQQQLVIQVSENLKALQNKLEEIQHKHNLLRSRQTVADVNKAVASASADQNLDDTFERWESMVLEHELASSDSLAVDPLEQELGKQEQDAALLAQLQALAGKSATTDAESNHE